MLLVCSLKRYDKNALRLLALQNRNFFTDLDRVENYLQTHCDHLCIRAPFAPDRRTLGPFDLARHQTSRPV